jgi:putative N6-adenine-specific DNA methylase
MEFFATAAKGTEGALRDELRELGLNGVRADRGGVFFSGTLGDGGYACLWTRIGVRILAKVAEFDAPDGNALYEGVSSVDWTPYLSPKRTLAVRANCRSSALTHSQYVAQRTKDAIVDRLRDHFGERPSVDRDDPDVLVAVHLARDRADVYVDLGGASLHRRGYRADGGIAPLKETLAAAVVRLSGWDRVSPFLDPMCGAGTLAIEAALWARAIAPGLGRTMGFERWELFDDTMRRSWRAMLDEARASAKGSTVPVRASDVDRGLVERARANARAAGVDLALTVGDVRSAESVHKGFVVTNPPYDERLPVHGSFYNELGAALARMRGSTVAVLAGSSDLARALERATGHGPDRWLALYNGPLECRLLVYGL